MARHQETFFFFYFLGFFPAFTMRKFSLSGLQLCWNALVVFVTVSNTKAIFDCVGEGWKHFFLHHRPVFHVFFFLLCMPAWHKSKRKSRVKGSCETADGMRLRWGRQAKSLCACRMAMGKRKCIFRGRGKWKEWSFVLFVYGCEGWDGKIHFFFVDFYVHIYTVRGRKGKQQVCFGLTF